MIRLDELTAVVCGNGWRYTVSTHVMVCAVLASTGCYKYATVDMDSVVPGETVRARLSTDGQRDLPPLANGESGVLEGRLLENSSDGLLLFVPSMILQVGFRFETMNQRLLISREHLLTLDQRQLDQTRTVVLLGIVGVATGVALTQILSGTSGSSSGPNGPDGPSVHVAFLMHWLAIH